MPNIWNGRYYVVTLTDL